VPPRFIIEGRLSKEIFYFFGFLTFTGEAMHAWFSKVWSFIGSYTYNGYGFTLLFLSG